MITYKLAKQLKDAGFPFNQYWSGGDVIIKGSECRFNGKKVFGMKSGTDKDKILVTWHYIPTLSELIEATKQKGRLLSLEETKDGWEAKLDDWDSKEYGKRRCYEMGDETVAWKKGKTPEEAVVELWLRLNEIKT